MRSPIKWVGGKSKLAKTIVTLMPEHTCYVEVFGGAGWVLFQKERSSVEVLNDLDGELVNFFRVVKERPQALIREFDWSLAGREEFERLKAQTPTTLGELERAYRFYYLIMASWGGELENARFQTSIADGGHGNRLIGALKTVRKRLLDAHKRLQTVVIEHLDWAACVDQYDDERTFFYLDPPYPGNNCNYTYNMRSLVDHKALFERLASVQAKWLLSTYDKPELRELAKLHEIKPVTFASGMPGNGRKNQEILVANFPLE